MSFNKRGNISIFVCIVMSLVSLGVGAQMMCNFSVYQLSQSYHVLRECLLIQKMLSQGIEEVILSKYELSPVNASEPLNVLFKKEINLTESFNKLKFKHFEIKNNSLEDSYRGFIPKTFIFEKYI